MKSADRALRVLQTLARHAKPMPTMAIARSCNVPKSSAHNLLNTMRAHGFVSYYPADHAWGLGPAAFEVGAAYLRSGALERLAGHELPVLAASTEASAQLWAPVGAEVVCVDCVAPDGVVAALMIHAGTRLPAVATAPGRVMLATLSPAQARLMSPDAPQPHLGARERWVDTGGLEGIRGAGYAQDLGTLAPGVGCVAAAVVARDGLPLGAVSVIYMAAGPDGERLEALGEAVVRSASRLSGSIAGGIALNPQTTEPAAAD